MDVRTTERAFFDLEELAVEVTGGELRLFKDGLTVTPDTTVAQLNAVEADFGGYAAIVLPAPGQIFQEPNFVRKMVTPTQQFNASGVAPANDIGGYYVIGLGGTALRIVVFDEPIHMETALDSIPITLLWQEQGSVS